MTTVTTVSVQHDGRAKGSVGMCIGTIIFDDGDGSPIEQQQVVFECLAGEDPVKRLEAMVPQRQIDRLQAKINRTQDDLAASAKVKFDNYLATVDAKTLKDVVGLTDDEVSAVTAAEVVVDTEPAALVVP